MRSKFWLLAALILLGLVLLIGHGSSKVSSSIVDVSWPNCKVKQNTTYASGIIGITGGLDFHKNACLAKESTWFLRYAVYINTGYPGDARGRRYQNTPRRCGPHDSSCLAYNYGFQEALYAIKYADLQNVHTNLWWLDVETENSWTGHLLANRQFINGAIAGIKQHIWFATVGVYSSPHQWQQINGQWHNGLPVWQATGSLRRDTAVKACRTPAFTGGSLWLTQYTMQLDQNVACSAQFAAHLDQPL